MNPGTVDPADVTLLLAAAARAVAAAQDAVNAAAVDLEAEGAPGPALGFERIAHRACVAAYERLGRAADFHTKARQLVDGEPYRYDI